jgi:hypothetical protein
MGRTFNFRGLNILEDGVMNVNWTQLIQDTSGQTSTMRLMSLVSLVGSFVFGGIGVVTGSSLAQEFAITLLLASFGGKFAQRAVEGPVQQLGAGLVSQVKPSIPDDHNRNG